MKKFIFMLIAMFTFAIGSINAQTQNDYAGSSKFTDNVSVTLQGGVLTSFNNFYSGHTAMAPIILIGADKYVTPWLGFGVEGRTLVGTGHGSYNTYTAFDYVNVSGLAKVNLANAFKFDGTRKFFEPVVYTGLGWGHQTASYGDNHNNWMTYRAGAEFNFNLGEDRAWGIVVNPSVVWNDIDNGKLVKKNGSFEITAGVVYRFKNSNGKHSFAKAHLYDAAEVAALNKKINELESREPVVIEKIVEKPVAANTVACVGSNVFIAPFKFNSSVLSDKCKSVLDNIAEGTTVVIDAYASSEPKSSAKYNTKLSVERANAVKKYLESRGVKVTDTAGHGMDDDFGRVAIVTVK